MKKLVLATGSAILLFMAGNVFADTKIAVIDISKIIAESPQVAAAKAQLKKQFDPREQEIVDAQKTLRADVDNYSKNSPTMKSDEAKTAQQKIMDEQKKLQDMESKFQNDLSTEQNSVMQKIMKKVESITTKIAEDKKYDLVVTKMSAAYSNPKLDITSDVIDEMKK